MPYNYIIEKLVWALLKRKENLDRHKESKHSTAHHSLDLPSHNPVGSLPKPPAEPESTALRPYPTVLFTPYSHRNKQGMVAASEGKIAFFKIEDISGQANMKKIGDYCIDFEVEGIQNFGGSFIIHGRNKFIFVGMERGQIEENTGQYLKPLFFFSKYTS